jgi:hypothetical protein
MEGQPEDVTENLSFPLAIFSILLPSDQSYFRRKLGDLIFAALQRRAFPPQSLQNWGGISKFSFRPLSGNDSDERLFCAIFFSGVIWFCLGNMPLPKMSQPESGWLRSAASRRPLAQGKFTACLRKIEPVL